MSKLGLCFSGGGARGAYQIGVAQALSDLGILENVVAYSGTSIGAANSLMLATNSLESCKEVWFEISEDSLMKSKGLLERIRHEGMKVFEEGIYSIDALESLLCERVDLDKFKNVDVFATIAEVGNEKASFFDILKASYKHYRKEENRANYIDLKMLQDKDLIIQTVIASCSIPIIFSPVLKDGKKYYDGGIYDNVPVQPLIDMGCDEIIVVHLHRLHMFRPGNYPGIVFHEIKHKGSLGSVLDFTNEHSSKIYEYGYQDAMKYFNKDL